MPNVLHVFGVIGENLTPWSDYGIAGLLVGVLFSLVVLFINSTSKQQKEHSKSVERLVEEGRKERSEMTERWSKSSDKLAEAVECLTREVSRLNK